MAAPSRGRHRSSDKEGRRTLARIEAVDGVVGVVIGHSVGGKALGRTGAAGDFRLQAPVPGGYKGVLQTSRGIQEVFVRFAPDGDAAAIADDIATTLARAR